MGDVVSKNILSPSLANSSVCSVESQFPSLPMFVLYVRAKALEEFCNKPLHSQKEVKLVSQPIKLVKNMVYVGSFTSKARVPPLVAPCYQNQSLKTCQVEVVVVL